jgi:hypothetical protein
MLGPEPHGAIADGPLPMSMSTQPGPVKAAQKVQGLREFCSPVPTAAPVGLLTTCLSWPGHRAKAQVWPRLQQQP